MKSKFWLLPLFCLIGNAVVAQTDTSIITTASAQKDTTDTAIVRVQTNAPATGNVGDPAPLLRVREWVKGAPVTTFEKGKVYVVEFWATWCRPCRAAMPHLSGLARHYRDKVTFSAIDVLESHSNMPKSSAQLKAFVDNMGRKMDFSVAAEDTAYTTHDWLDVYNRRFIPATFVINREGRVAWIGHPLNLDTVLQKIVDNAWDIKGELSAKTYKEYLEKLDTSVISKVRRYQPTFSGPNYLGFPDSTLMVVDDMVKKEPMLKYAPWVAQYTFSALLLTDPHRAYEFGKQVIVTPTYQMSAYENIIDAIRDDSHHLTTPKEIYLLGTECYQARIDRSPNSTSDDMAKNYHEMAEWYRLGDDKAKAIAAEKKAIKFWEKDLKDSSK